MIEKVRMVVLVVVVMLFVSCVPLAWIWRVHQFQQVTHRGFWISAFILGK